MTAYLIYIFIVFEFIRIYWDFVKIEKKIYLHIIIKFF